MKTEIKGFLHWQWDRIRSARISDWLYFLAIFTALYAGVAPTSATVIFGITLDVWLMILAGGYVFGYVLFMIVSWQYGCYRREKELIARELERK